ncbi:MAG: hypothetical protein IJ713_05705 [Oscillibacter sp.]|nr:hypothetical protein [Oscillibacter sp.]
MKKFLSMALALAMAAALAVPAMATSGTAETITTSGGALDDLNDKAEIDVTAKVTTSGGGVEVTHGYYVVISWTDAEIGIKGSTSKTTYTWDGSTKAYTVGGGNTSYSLDESDKTVTINVLNQSDVAVKVGASYAAKDGNGTQATFTGTTDSLASIVTFETDGAPTKTAWNTASDVFNSTDVVATITDIGTVESSGQIGTITVTISAA